MGLRPKPLFWAERIEEKRQSERDLIGTGGKIDELYKVIEFRPNIKVISTFPQQMKWTQSKTKTSMTVSLSFLIQCPMMLPT